MNKIINTSGTVKKDTLGLNIKVFQYLLYKGKEIFQSEVINLPEKNTIKTSIITKVKEAIDSKIPTVALAFFKISKYYNQEVIDPGLQETLELCNLPSEETFMRSAFSEGSEVDVPQLGEYYYYLMKIGTDSDVITDLIFERFGDQTITKYSDFLNLGIVLTNPDLFNQNLTVHIDSFYDNVVNEYLNVFANDIKISGLYPDTFKKDFKDRYKYFSEGIKKWTFLDDDIKDKKLKVDVRDLAMTNKYKFMTTRGSSVMLEKLQELYEYISFCYMNLKKFQFRD